MLTNVFNGSFEGVNLAKLNVAMNVIRVVLNAENVDHSSNQVIWYATRHVNPISVDFVVRSVCLNVVSGQLVGYVLYLVDVMTG